MNVQRLRNITTGRMHTRMSHIYEDLGRITGERGLMTHMLPRMLKAVRPWLLEHVTEPRFWDGRWDSTHVGEYPLPEPTHGDQAAMLARFRGMPDPLANKRVLMVHV